LPWQSRGIPHAGWMICTFLAKSMVLGPPLSPWSKDVARPNWLCIFALVRSLCILKIDSWPKDRNQLETTIFLDHHLVVSPYITASYLLAYREDVSLWYTPYRELWHNSIYQQAIVYWEEYFGVNSSCK